ncbi:Ni/Fe hydrogenase subunit alpha [Amphritea balenae]|uniref:Ni/Fe hydrogenase subunit alpha n=1 Tax=Amphritea balenae TaxID=452629 RepID=A0A3P1SN49_9GAMM|nr:Ni/Fe hydrogenase subunit alpha [Amphritea balenae]RRC98578.1 Ni/Fe hydrogenase subunit alpha [Amphritea balenae]GGK65657.1 Ni/Fe hydrogenase subunit alpha [Amphritea balenae]
MSKRNLSIRVPILARVEGEGAMDLDIRDGAIEKLQLRIYEPPRFFEKFLEGRAYHEIPDVVARICGICPVAYQVSAVNAIESAFNMDPGPWVKAMRRLIYLGEWIESHALHIHLLALPDFFGYQSGIAMAKDHPAEVRRGLKLQNLGNEIMRCIGARSVHPVSIKVGGLHKAPDDAKLARLLRALEEALPEALEMCDWLASIPLPDDQQTFNCTALKAANYAVEDGILVSSTGLNLKPEQYDQHFTEFHQPQSTALWSHMDGEAYLVGPLARMNLTAQTMPAISQPVMHKFAHRFPSNNMFDSMLARGIEIVFAMQEAISILQGYSRPQHSFIESTPQESQGQGWSEAPRGLLWHHYELDRQGIVRKARLVPPTSQNQARIEQDLHRSLLNFGLDNSDDDIRLHCEKVIRNYDPCISCATHFLKLNTVRR